MEVFSFTLFCIDTKKVIKSISENFDISNTLKYKNQISYLKRKLINNHICQRSNRTKEVRFLLIQSFIRLSRILKETEKYNDPMGQIEYINSIKNACESVLYDLKKLSYTLGVSKKNNFKSILLNFILLFRISSINRV